MLASGTITHCIPADLSGYAAIISDYFFCIRMILDFKSLGLTRAI